MFQIVLFIFSEIIVFLMLFCLLHIYLFISSVFEYSNVRVYRAGCSHVVFTAFEFLVYPVSENPVGH